ncbi:TPA: hypothetical protein L5C15_005761 [Pseudomonas aeruginosa]|uniref:hypothetical protein n=1 Tax=Pseudomonas aeruginosa TaxID=287 RepID=UPI00117BD2A1|nr:hypothetical protein [Pseudomonas aeruginosa]HBO7934624.1 hypothetical protein [Pseudomonas aeruginosa]HBO8188566.1 hypothetical protein [Pseudomonas aeruginosa]HBO8713815.1 hypothetical protein [Pseudomonas aeruginosa]HCF2449061.1 hypothetical protein [Pseudomonas aeruginosa]
MNTESVLQELHKELLKKYPSPFSANKRIQYRRVLADLESQIKMAQASGCSLLESFGILAQHFPDKPNRLAWASAWSQIQKEKRS